MKKLLIVILILTLLTGCGAPQAATEATGSETVPGVQRTKVGISLPEEDPYWKECATQLEVGLMALELEPVVLYAENDVFLQAQQVAQLYADPTVACMIIAPIDAMALVEAQQLVRAGGIPVIALDRPLMDTDAVKYCVSYDYQAIGVAMGQHIEKELALETAQQEQRSHTVEFFMGSADDQNALLLHEGIMSVLAPYLASGVLICPSGRVSFEDSCISRGDGALAGERLTRYIQQYYTPDGIGPEVCCTASDALAAGCIAALEALQCPPEQWPLITGQGCGGEAEARIAEGKQSMTAVKSISALTKSCILAVTALLGGTVPEGDAQVDNHVIGVPTRLCPVSYVEGQAQTAQ